MARKVKSRLHGRPHDVTHRAEPRPSDRETGPEPTANPLIALHQVVGNQTMRRMIQRQQLPPGAFGAGHARLGNQTIQRLLTASSPAAQRRVIARQVSSLLQRNGGGGRTTIRYDDIRFPITGLNGGPIVTPWQPGLQTPTSSTTNPLPFPLGGTTTPFGDGPIKIFDVTRGPMDLLSLRLPPSSDRTREEVPPDRTDEERFSEEELRELQEEEELRRAPEMYERVMAELKEARRQLLSSLKELYAEAKPVGLDVSDLVRHHRKLQRDVRKLEPHEVYLYRDTFRAEIETLARNAESRLKLVKELAPLIRTVEKYVDDIRLDLEAIDEMLANEKTRYRQKHLRTIRGYWDDFGKLESQTGKVIARYRLGDAVTELKKTIVELKKLSNNVEAFGSQVEDDQPYGSGGISQALGSAKTVVMVGRYGKLTQSVYKRIDSKVLPDKKLQELLDNVTTGQGGQGVKALSSKIKGGYTHELKFLGTLGGNRIFGKVDKSDNKVLFTKYGAHL